MCYMCAYITIIKIKTLNIFKCQKYYNYQNIINMTLKNMKLV